MKLYKINENLSISSTVIAQYAGIATNECPGVVGMAMFSVKNGFYRILNKNHLANGVDVDIKDKKLILNLHIIALYGINVPNLAFHVMNNVNHILQNSLGIKDTKINILVEGLVMS